MAKNDQVLVDGLIDARVATRIPSDDRSEAFEYFVFEQVLKHADLSGDELLAGRVDGFDDGGIDGWYLFVNGHPVLEPANFQWPKRTAELSLWFFTCKHNDTFQQVPIDKLIASTTELLDLGLQETDLVGKYSTDILRKRRVLSVAYRRLAASLTRFELNVIYASRGDTTMIGPSVQARANQLKVMVAKFFTSCVATVRFIGALELVEAHRRTRAFALELPFVECFWRGSQHVLLCTLHEYWRFVSDERGVVKRHLLDSNVRDSLGLNAVNEDIITTLESPGVSDFWWMNNGVTILATRASVAGKVLSLDDVQIVNGLQTTETIARYYRDGGQDQKRLLLVKVIVSEDATVRDDIIRATNNQTAIEHASLRATDKVQRDIEDIFERDGEFHYERRKNYHANQGVELSRIVSPLYVASGYVSLILKSPHYAARLRQRFMRDDLYYSHVFSTETPLPAWPAIVRILKTCDMVLERNRSSRASQQIQKFLKSWRHLVALIATARVYGWFSFSAKDIMHHLPSENIVTETWEFVDKRSAIQYVKSTTPGRGMLRNIIADAAAEFSIKNAGVVEQRHPFVAKNELFDLGESFLSKVDRALPEQPWKIGIHHIVAKRLNCSPSKVSAAITTLMESGRRNFQKDGIVYDSEGTVIAVDTSRVSGGDKTGADKERK